ncbi:MAG: NAD(P)/FAD-dependent oxidoreductase [Lewinellaceae bacterium]|nr:NAD(P)/FAD-dependent oxidoreductase [Lewinellaceae bacterium]
MDIAIIGGGAAGFFAAITCAEANPEARVQILERGNAFLQKVKVSGGGRCNVTHHCFEPRELVKFYPRGFRELLGPFLQFGPEQTVAWFESRGVRLKTEEDGRMFPVTDDSQTIIDCLTESALAAGVQLRKAQRVAGISREKGRWKMEVTGQEPIFADKIMLATGSSEAVWQWLAALDHPIVPPVPSLFTFNTKDTRLRDLAGIAVPAAILEIPDLKLKAEGPLLVTHWGLSGPAVLRLSAWGARALHAQDYRFRMSINWTSQPGAAVLHELQQIRQEQGKKQVHTHAFFQIPLRLWQSLSGSAGLSASLRWADADNKTLQRLQTALCAGEFDIFGKSTFKEEFVTAGGVDLKAVNFKQFSSKILPNLFFAGEVLNIDAITGGFNFQAAWTGGWLAGHAMAESGV